MPLFPQPATTTNSNNIFNLVFTTSVAANALTVNFIANNTQAAATTANPATVGFGSGGQIAFISLTSAYSFTVPSGATLGTASNVSNNLYIYALNVSGVLKGAISFIPFIKEDTTITTVALTSGSILNNRMYSDGLYSGVTYRLIGLINITEVTAGQWASNATNVVPWSPYLSRQPICARYSTNAFLSVPNTNSPTLINFGNKAPGYDPYNCVTNPTSNWAFNAPFSGYYHVEANILYSTGAWAVNNFALLDVYVLGSIYCHGTRFEAGVAVSQYVSLNISVDVLASAGNTITFFTYHNRTAGALTLNNDDQYCWCTISQLPGTGV